MKISSGPPGWNFREGKEYIRQHTLMLDTAETCGIISINPGAKMGARQSV